MWWIPLFACEERPPHETVGPSSTTPEPHRPHRPGVTTWDDVAPVLTARCATCHQPGGIGMDLTEWSLAAPWSEVMALATAQRSMPPWLVTSDGSCGEFLDPLVLTDEEIAAFADWAAAGAPEGSGAPLHPPTPPQLTEWDVELVTPLDTPEPEGGTLGSDEYRCYRVSNPEQRDWYLTGSSVAAVDPEITHHVMVFIVEPGAKALGGTRTNERVLTDLENDDLRPGWDCLGSVGGTATDRGVPVSWSPGTGIASLPDGLGMRIRPQDDLVVQIHYTMPTPAQEGRTGGATVHVRFARSVEREAHLASPDKLLASAFSAEPDTLPPGRDDAGYSWRQTVEQLAKGSGIGTAPHGLDLWSVTPHMHGRGRTIILEYQPDPEDREQDVCLAEVLEWDQDWQRGYRLAAPFTLAPGSRVRVKCTYDTRADVEPVAGGWSADDEMCTMGLVLTERAEPPPEQE